MRADIVIVDEAAPDDAYTEVARQLRQWVNYRARNPLIAGMQRWFANSTFNELLTAWRGWRVLLVYSIWSALGLFGIRFRLVLVSKLSRRGPPVVRPPGTVLARGPRAPRAPGLSNPSSMLLTRGGPGLCAARGGAAVA